jgi:hypothetical protein
MCSRWSGVAVCSLFFPCAAFSGAWVQPEGATRFILNASAYSASEAFDAAGRRGAVGEFSKYEINPYLEYGLSPAWTVGGSVFLNRVAQENPGGGESDNYGLGESEIFFRSRLYERDGVVVSAQPLLRFSPLYRGGGEPSAARSGWDGELGLLAGYGFDAYGQHHYLDGKLGYRYRSGAPGDQFRVQAAAGLGVSETVTVLTEAAWTGEAETLPANSVSLSGQNDYSLLRGQVSALWAYDERHTAQLGVFRHLRGEETGAGGGVLLAWWTRW